MFYSLSSTMIVLPIPVRSGSVWESGSNSKRYLEWRVLVDNGAWLFPRPETQDENIAIIKEIVQQVEKRESHAYYRRPLVRRISN